MSRFKLFLRRALAFIRRTFWTQCPRCGTQFSGLEPYAENVMYLIDTDKALNFRIVCGACASSGVKQLPKWVKFL
jgi:hypothetical protein